jgi:hypothetical protein
LETKKIASGANTITVTMYPLMVNTRFTGAAGSVSPAGGTKPQPAYLSPGEWEVRWMLQRASAEKNGLEKLIEAQGLISGGAGDLKVLKKKTGAGSELTEESGVSTANVITRGGISAAALGESGSVYFNLEYAPFLGETNPWDSYGGTFMGAWDAAHGPVWIIRNGANDAAQDGKTDFSKLGRYAGDSLEDANGNGTVRFVVGVEPGTTIPATPSDSTLKITDGVFESVDRTDAVIGFTTGGYTAGTAQVYYAAVNAGSDAPTSLSGYTGYLGEFTLGAHTGTTINLQAANNDVSLIA